MDVAASFAGEASSPLEPNKTKETLAGSVDLGLALLELLMAAEQAAKRNSITYGHSHS